jgi:hypothetical protein
VGDRPPGGWREGWSPRADMPMLAIPPAELASRLGSRQTEVGAATRAMSGREEGG